MKFRRVSTIDQNSLVIGTKSHAHYLTMNNYLFNSINNINSVEFSIDNELLDYIKVVIY